jgi:hypothetical protein
MESLLRNAKKRKAPPDVSNRKKLLIFKPIALSNKKFAGLTNFNDRQISQSRHHSIHHFASLDIVPSKPIKLMQSRECQTKADIPPVNRYYQMYNEIMLSNGVINLFDRYFSHKGHSIINSSKPSENQRNKIKKSFGSELKKSLLKWCINGEEQEI